MDIKSSMTTDVTTGKTTALIMSFTSEYGTELAFSTESLPGPIDVELSSTVVEMEHTTETTMQSDKQTAMADLTIYKIPVSTSLSTTASTRTQPTTGIDATMAGPESSDSGLVPMTTQEITSSFNLISQTSTVQTRTASRPDMPEQPVEVIQSATSEEFSRKSQKSNTAETDEPSVVLSTLASSSNESSTYLEGHISFATSPVLLDVGKLTQNIWTPTPPIFTHGGQSFYQGPTSEAEVHIAALLQADSSMPATISSINSSAEPKTPIVPTDSFATSTWLISSKDQVNIVPSPSISGSVSVRSRVMVENTGDPTSTSSSSDGSRDNDAFDPNEGTPQTPKQRAKTAGIAMGVVGMSVMFGAITCIISRKHGQRRKPHRRLLSPTSSQSSLEIRCIGIDDQSPVHLNAQYQDYSEYSRYIKYEM